MLTKLPEVQTDGDLGHFANLFNFSLLVRLLFIYLFVSKILALEKTQINLDFCSLIRIFATERRGIGSIPPSFFGGISKPKTL